MSIPPPSASSSISTPKLRPGPVAVLTTWFCVAASVSLTLLGLLGVSDFRARQEVRQVAEMMRHQQFKAALDLAQAGVASETVDALLAKTVGFSPRAPASALALALIEAAEVARTLAAGRPADPPDGLPTALTELFQDLAGISRSIKEIELEITRRRHLARRAVTDFLPVALRAAKLFSLAAEPAIENQPLPVYQSGFLEGVPRLVGLDDGLQDIDQLETALMAARGKVLVSGPNPANAFAEELAAIRRLARSVVEDYSANAVEADRLTAQVSATRKDRAEQLRKFTSVAAETLLEDPSLQPKPWHNFLDWLLRNAKLARVMSPA